MPGFQPAIHIHAMPAPPRGLVRRFEGWIRAAIDSAALVTTQPCDRLPRATAATEDHTQHANGGRVEVIIRPVVAFLHPNGGLDSRAVGPGFGHHFRSLIELLRVDAGDFGGHFRFRLFLGQNPALPVVEPLDLEMTPGGTPLPGRVAGALTEARIGFPEIGGPPVDEFLILPAVFHDDPLDRHMHHGVGAGIQVDMQTTVFFGIRSARRLAGVGHDDLGFIPVDAFEDPLIPQHGLGFEWIGARYEQAIGQCKVFEACAENVVTDIDPTGCGIDYGWMIVVCHGRCIDALESQLGQGIGVLKILIVVILERPGMFAVFPDDVFRYRGHDIQGEIPGDRHQNIVDPDHRVLQPVMGGFRWVVNFLGDASAANAVISADIDDPAFVIGDDGDIVEPAIMECLGELVGADPATFQGPQRVILV